MRFGRKKNEDSLYQQWTRHSNLPPEVIPQKEASQDVPAKIEKTKRNRNLYIILGVAISLICVGLVLLFTKFG